MLAMKKSNTMIIVGIITAVSVSMLFYTQAIAVSEPVSISIKRVEKYDDVNYIQISSSVLSSYPSILKSINEADVKYDDFAKLCGEHSGECGVSTSPIFVDEGYTKIIDTIEAKNTMRSFGFEDVLAPGEVTALIHGINVEVNGKYYAILISGINS